MAVAAKYTHPRMYYCTENHLKSETASTDQFHMMCKGHVPVHLFETCTDQTFVKYHYDVSIFFESLTILGKIRFKKRNTVHIVFYLLKTQEYRAANHSVHVIFTCTRCGQNFDRSDSLEILSKHEEQCALMVPKFRRICRICGLVCSLNCHRHLTLSFFSP